MRSTRPKSIASSAPIAPFSFTPTKQAPHADIGRGAKATVERGGVDDNDGAMTGGRLESATDGSGAGFDDETSGIGGSPPMAFKNAPYAEKNSVRTSALEHAVALGLIT